MADICFQPDLRWITRVRPRSAQVRVTGHFPESPDSSVKTIVQPSRMGFFWRRPGHSITVPQLLYLAHSNPGVTTKTAPIRSRPQHRGTASSTDLTVPVRVSRA